MVILSLIRLAYGLHFDENQDNMNQKIQIGERSGYHEVDHDTVFAVAGFGLWE